MSVVDPVFGIDDYNKPKVLSEDQTIVTNLMLVLLTKPNQYPSQPTLGMDISQWLYMFYDEIDTTTIKAKIVNQCKDFLDYINDDTLQVEKRLKDNKPILVFVLPSIEKTKSEITLAMTTNVKGEIIYNFMTTSTDTQIV